ncbi:P-loop containing nucleoside triphosphate hydrolase protein [Rhodotorula diobovata]|uniref:P-loop containing nucleoside triphosphate hydrolase protein n=1 Tax=Rhodotorula diobovata TaxID=5288 RepID=A0A5C5FUN5_9BASI|nr:P-loop containing nucleoside triphosphate hydrolase protein [Rhodotorula diobovata]
MTTPSGKLIGPKQRKVALLGSRSVGKSSLTVQFVDQHFVDSYYPTIENTFTKMVKYKGQDFQLDIIDTAGQDEFSILSSRHAVGLHGWILVYSVSSRSSFEMCSIIREKILNYTGRDSVPMVLVGNKSDLAVQRCARSLTRSPEPLSRGSLTPLSVPRSPRAQASDA